MPIKEALNKFKEYLKVNNYTERTVGSYINYVDIFARYLKQKGIKKLEDITRDAVDQYQIDLSTKNQYTKQYLTLKTQMARLCAIIVFFRFLYEKNVIDRNPASHIKLPKVPKSPPSNYLTYKEIISILKAADQKDLLGIRDKAMLELLYSVGMRNSELRNLTIADIDFTNHIIRIFGKGKKERIIPIGKVALDYIQEYMERSRPFLLNPHKPTDILFLSKRGNKLCEEMLPYIVRKYKSRTSIEKYINAHTFRHSMATHLLMRGMDLRSLQEMLGHNSIETTQIYTHIDLKDLKRVYAKTHPRENDLL